VKQNVACTHIKHAHISLNVILDYLIIRCSAIIETVLQGVLVLAKIGRLKLGDNILQVYLQPL